MSKPFEPIDIVPWIGKICLVIVLFVIINSLFDDLMFRVKYSFPKPYKTTQEIIKIEEPTQIDFIEKIRPIAIKGFDTGKDYTLTPVAKYKISGLVVAKNTNFWFRGINRSEFDDVALMDIGIAWDEIADKNFIKKNLVFSSKKTLGSSRILYTRVKNSSKLSIYEAMSKSSHTHLVPANQNVMSAMLLMKKYQPVKLEGYLIDITYPNGKTAYTSITRTDNNSNSRGMQITDSGGGGACEIMYVKQVQIGNKIYK